MAWLAVDKSGDEYLYLNEPERYIHYNVFDSREIDYEIWAADGSNVKLSPGTIKKLLGYDLTWKDNPVQI